LFFFVFFYEIWGGGGGGERSWIVTVITMNIAECWDVLLTRLTVRYHVGS